jgi:multidrug efflux pump subunit AcrA (membrane-fusion protein)
LRDRVEGTPVKTGDVLFEVAPLDRVRVEIEVPAGEVSTVEVGQTVTLWLEGLESSEISGTIQSLAPESEVSEGKNVFIAELELDNAPGQMRPGMRGRTRIDSPGRPLGRVLFQPVWEWCLSRWG